jgi:hypothetical protein
VGLAAGAAVPCCRTRGRRHRTKWRRVGTRLTRPSRRAPSIESPDGDRRRYPRGAAPVHPQKTHPSAGCLHGRVDDEIRRRCAR